MCVLNVLELGSGLGPGSELGSSILKCVYLQFLRPCRREWLRALWSSDFHSSGDPSGGDHNPHAHRPHVVGALEPHKSLMEFFERFPGLRQLIGGLIVLYSRFSVKF